MFNYDDIGKKIKGLAKASFIVEAIGAIITGFAFLIGWGLDAWWALFIIFFGPIVAWVSSWLLYGFGELIDKTIDIEENTRNGQPKPSMHKSANKSTKKSKKNSSNDTTKRDATMPDTPKNFDEIEFIDCVCPNCQETLSFTTETQEAQCPFCENTIIIKR